MTSRILIKVQTLRIGTWHIFDEFVVYILLNGLGSVVELQSLADVCGVPLRLPLGLNGMDEKVVESREDFTEDSQIEQLIRGNIPMIKYAGSPGDCR